MAPSNPHAVSQSKPGSVRSFSLKKKLLLGGTITVATFLFLELVLWIARVEPAWMGEDPYAGFSRHIPHFVRETDPNGQVFLTVAPTKSRVLNPQRFAAQKPAGTYRIVCLGGSTTYGRPFYDKTSFSGWLREFLPAAQASRNWEVINAGAISYASYRVTGVMEELAQYSPDLFVVYTGQNEFLERRTYGNLAQAPSLLTETASIANRTRIATVVRRSLELAGVRSQQGAHRAPVLGEETKAIPINAVGPEAYHRDDSLASNVVHHFSTSLQRMVHIAKSVKADILFVVPASNLVDFEPFRSEHVSGLTTAQLEAWDRHFFRAKGLASNGQHEAAVREFELAEAIDPRFADLAYQKARSLVALGRYDLAKQAFRRAKDEDVCPLRAISRLVQTVRDTATTDGVLHVDFESLVDRHSEHSLPGKAMFHDHVHPTIEANRLLALAIVETMTRRGIVQPEPSWSDATRESVTAKVQASIDRPLHAQQLRLLSAMMGWLQQPEQARLQAGLSLELSGTNAEALTELAKGFKANNAPALATEYLQKAVDLAPDSAEIRLSIAASLMDAGKTTEAIQQLQATLAIKPDWGDAHTRLGAALASQGKFQEAEHHFAEAVRLIPNSEIALNNLGLAMARQGRFEEALAQHEHALKLAPQSADTHYNLGLALEALGRLDEARNAYLATLRLAPRHPHAPAKIRDLKAPPR
jgi:tetratricopeptide (TPR) repeat protein